ncbi:MAG: GNAT family N-acetyltransferase [Candidatus Methanoperedens sp.]|nr:GNAT family N-acetyltransferase [Candidatus Methanoperedens sp.]
MELEIRKAVSSDIRDIKRLLSFYFLDTENVEKNLHGFIVAVLNWETVGCAGLYANIELGAIAVLPVHRNKGIGSKLVDSVLERAACPGGILYLRTTVPSFFEKKGFTSLQNAEKKNIWKDCMTCDKFDNCRQTPMNINL